jgi:PI-3-kinase-related kinase SMG-1
VLRDLAHVVAAVPRLLAVLLTSAHAAAAHLQREQEATAHGRGRPHTLSPLSVARAAQARQAAMRGVFTLVADRIEGKVGKRDLDPEAHARWVVKQATGVDNLCRMYEGWTPWVRLAGLFVSLLCVAWR